MSLYTPETWAEYKTLLEEPGRKVHWRIDGELLVAGQPLLFSNIIALASYHRFDTDYYGYEFVRLKIDLVAYQHLIRHKNDIQFFLAKREQNMRGQSTQKEQVYRQLFNAKIANPQDPAIMALLGSKEPKDGGIVQSSSLIEITLQLVEPVIDDMSKETIGGSFWPSPGDPMTVKKLLRFHLSYRLEKEENKDTLLASDYLEIRGVDIVEPDNTREYDHILLHNRINLTQLPKFLQERYGIYSTGLGWHIYRGWCFIYPLLNYTNYEKRKKVLTILKVPASETPTLDKSFLNRPGEVYVFSTGDAEYQDRSEEIYQHDGNGVRMSRSSDLLDGFETTTGNLTYFDRKEKVPDFIIEERPKNKVHVPMVKGMFTDNPFKHASALSRSQGVIMSVPWTESAPEILYPGMPTRYIYFENDELITLDATLMGIVSNTTTSTGAITDQHFVTTTQLLLNIQRRDLA